LQRSLKNSTAKIAIIGAGISGLTAAFYLEKAGFDNISLFEKLSEVGGVLKTDFTNDCLIEQAAESIAKFPQSIFGLIDEIGLTNEVMEPVASKFQLWVDGKMIAPPEGLRYMVPTNLVAFNKSNFFSNNGVQRILQEPKISLIEKTENLTLKDFVVHRFGEEMYQRYAAPVYGGIFGYDADKLSLQTVMPQLLNWVKQHGSITKAVQNLPQKSNTGAVYFSFRNGVQSFADKLGKHLNKTNFFLNKPIKGITKNNEKWLVNEQLFDKVIITTTATITASLIQKVQPALSHLLKKIQFKTAGILTFWYDELLSEIDNNTSGILLPVNEFPTFSAITFSSNKWSGRTKAGKRLLRLYIRDADLIKQPKTLVEQKAIDLLKHLLKIEKKPTNTFLHWWPNSRPLYTTHHQQIVSKINNELAKTPNLYLGGCSYNGSGVASLVHQSKLLVEKINNI